VKTDDDLLHKEGPVDDVTQSDFEENVEYSVETAEISEKEIHVSSDEFETVQEFETVDVEISLTTGGRQETRQITWIVAQNTDGMWKIWNQWSLSDESSPAPAPTVASQFEEQSLTFRVTGGSSFEASATAITADLTVEDRVSSSKTAVAFERIDMVPGQQRNLPFTEESSVEYVPDVSGGDVSAGDGFEFRVTGTDENVRILEWDVELIWNPSDQEPTVIYADSS
jgi:hypothetical protein